MANTNLANGFDPSIIDKIDLDASLAISENMRDNRYADILNQGYSLVDASFYALRDVNTKGNAGGEVWQQFRNTPHFRSLQERADSGRKGLVASWVSTYKISRYLQNSVDQAAADDTHGSSEQSEIQTISDEDLQQFGEEQSMLVSISDEGGTVEIDQTFLESMVKEAESMESIIDQAGFGLEGASFPTVVRQAHAIASKVNLRKLADILGWSMPMVGSPERDNQPANTGSLAGYRNGEISPNITTRDRLGLLSGDLETLKRAAEGQLHNRQFERTENIGKGPVIFLRDESSSTRSGDGIVERDIRTLEMGFSAIFQKQNRDLVTLRWSSGVRTNETWRVGGSTIRYTHGEQGLQSHMSASLNGNTDLLPAIEDALVVADEYVDGCDIVIATDAKLDPLLEEKAPPILEEFKKRGGRVWVIVVGQTRRQDPMSWADGVVSMDDLIADSVDLKQIVRQMVKR